MDLTKNIGTCYTKVVFLHPAGSARHVMHSGASGARNVIALFFMLMWDWYGFNKDRTGRRYAELVFLHPMGFADHVEHFGASRP
jgi:hypothetical protein